MKTFLTLCTCAMIAAGVYGFADMVGDVKNGTMIRYDQGLADVSSGAVAVAMMDGKKLSTKVFASSEVKQETVKQEAAVKIKGKKKIVKVEERVKAKEDEASTVITEEKVETDVKIDSAPQAKVVEEDYQINYREFSRGESRSHKSKKHKKN